MTFTETELLEALRKRHTHPGNGGAGRYAFLTHVRTGHGHYQGEIDAVVMALWESEYLEIHAFEVKTYRADWLREIRPSTAKSRRARELADTFTIVAPAGVVDMDGDLPELPNAWGLLEASRNSAGEVRLKRRQHAVSTTRSLYLPGSPLQTRALLMPRTLVVAMLRAAGAVPGMTTHQRGALSAVDAVE